MVSVTTVRNQVQKIGTIPLNLRKVNETPDANFYICPAGKTALIKGTAVCTGTGAGTLAYLQANGVTILQWNSGNPYTVGESYPFECQLNAGEALSKSQSSGTNAEINVNAKIQETEL